MFTLRCSSSARILALLALAAAGQSAHATTYWSANPSTPDDWFDANAWSAGVPSTSQGAYITNGGTAMISYGTAYTNGISVGTNNLNDSSSSGTLLVTAGQLASPNAGFYVGYANGYPGAEGLVNQSGGEVTATNLYIATTEYCSGTYDLSGNADLAISNSESIGTLGQFIQTGGANVAESLSISYGTYSMSGNSTLSVDSLTVGANNSTATFLQSGGTVSVAYSSSALDISGTYSISNGGALNVGQTNIVGQPNIYLGYYGNTVFTQTNSTCNFGYGSLYLGNTNFNGGTVSYTLSGNSQLNAGNEYIGNGNRASFTQTGGTNNLGTNTLSIGPSGDSYTMSGNSILLSGNQIIGGSSSSGTDTFIQYSGTNSLGNYSLYVGEYNSTSSYSMQTGATLMAGNEYIGCESIAVFTQNGGSNIVGGYGGGTLNIGTNMPNYGGNGEYFLNAGSLTSSAVNIGYASAYTSALFDQAGGTNISDAFLMAASGRYDLLAGILQITKSFSNSGTFDLQNPVSAGLSGINTLILAPLAITGTGTFEVEQNAALYAGSITQGSLIIGGKIQIAPGSATSKINSLNLTGGTLDINNNALIIDYSTAAQSPLSAIRGYLHSGYASNWTGPGIVSSTAAGDMAVSIGYGENSDLGLSTFGGVAVDNTAILIRYTWIGDANLDGIVNAADLAMIQANGTTWDTGDFNYDGIVNADDYALFDLGLAESGGGTIPLPESQMFVALVIPMLLRRRF